MAPSDLMNRSAAEFRADIIDGRRKKRRLKHLKDEFNICQRNALAHDIHLARPSHILATDTATAFGWRWEDGGWTFLGLADDELSDTPYYVLQTADHPQRGAQPRRRLRQLPRHLHRRTRRHPVAARAWDPCDPPMRVTY